MFSITSTRSTLMVAGKAMCLGAAVLCMPHALAAAGPEQSPPRQSSERFSAAIHNDSTSPDYVLITVVDDATGQARTGCNTANLLLGAIHMEYGLAYDAAGIANAKNVALTNPRHLFHFSKPEALSNIAFRYSPHDIEVARQLIHPLTDEQLRKAFSMRGELNETSSNAERDARACALIERGWRVRMADISGELILER
jgi:hypothetical protein